MIDEIPSKLATPYGATLARIALLALLPACAASPDGPGKDIDNPRSLVEKPSEDTGAKGEAVGLLTSPPGGEKTPREFRAGLVGLRRALDEPKVARLEGPLVEPPASRRSLAQDSATAAEKMRSAGASIDDLERIGFNDTSAEECTVSDLRKLYEDTVRFWSCPGKVPDLTPLRQPPVFEQARPRERTLLVSDGLGMAACSLETGDAGLRWARRIWYDTRVAEYHDRTPDEYRVSTLAKAWRDRRKQEGLPTVKPDVRSHPIISSLESGIPSSSCAGYTQQVMCGLYPAGDVRVIASR